MRKPRHVILGLTVLAASLLNPPTLAAQTSDETEVIAVVEGFHAALASGDSTGALAFLAEDVTILESGGVEDKAHYRSGHLAGDMRFAQAVPRERSPLQITLVGDVAWAHSTNVAQGQIGDREVNSQGAELVVLVRDGSAWVIKAIHWSSRARRNN